MLLYDITAGQPVPWQLDQIIIERVFREKRGCGKSTAKNTSCCYTATEWNGTGTWYFLFAVTCSYYRPKDDILKDHKRTTSQGQCKYTAHIRCSHRQPVICCLGSAPIQLLIRTSPLLSVLQVSCQIGNTVTLKTKEPSKPWFHIPQRDVIQLYSVFYLSRLHGWLLVFKLEVAWLIGLAQRSTPTLFQFLTSSTFPVFLLVSIHSQRLISQSVSHRFYLLWTARA